MPTLPIEGDLALYYEDDDFTDPWRSAPAMLLQHGFSRHAGFWYNWLPVLGREFRILRPDMRGMGRSTMPAERYAPSLATFAAPPAGPQGSMSAQHTARSAAVSTPGDRRHHERFKGTPTTDPRQAARAG